MEITISWWSRAPESLARAAGWGLLLLGTCASTSASASAETIFCPKLAGTHERYVQVFDGSPQEQVALMADRGDDHQGYWKLDYVYDAGRVVTVQCVYANHETRDITLTKRVNVCRYHVDAAGKTKLNCE